MLRAVLTTKIASIEGCVKCSEEIGEN